MNFGNFLELLEMGTQSLVQFLFRFCYFKFYLLQVPSFLFEFGFLSLSFLFHSPTCWILQLVELIAGKLEDNEYVTLLSWVLNVYAGPELMGHPSLNINVAKLGPLLENKVLEDLISEYLLVSYTISLLLFFLSFPLPFPLPPPLPPLVGSINEPFEGNRKGKLYIGDCPFLYGILHMIDFS